MRLQLVMIADPRIVAVRSHAEQTAVGGDRAGIGGEPGQARGVARSPFAVREFLRDRRRRPEAPPLGIARRIARPAELVVARRPPCVAHPCRPTPHYRYPPTAPPHPPPP